MENTLESKAKFLAQYYGCRVFQNDMNVKYNHESYKYPFMFENKGKDEYNEYAELTSLSDITDEDYRIIMHNKIMNPERIYDDAEISGRIGGLHLSEITTTDFLRSKGYALPYMSLSVEDLVNFGWIKLKQK